VEVIRPILISRGEVIGMGKFKVSASSIEHIEVPRLSFIVIKGSDRSFIATCIHLRLDGYGKTAKGAINDMIDNAYYFLRENFTNPKCKNNAWENLEDLFKCDEWSSDLWNLYHSVQVVISRQGRSTDNIDTLNQMLDKLERRVKRLEKNEEAQKLEREIVTIKKKIKETEKIDYVPVSKTEAGAA
jgi:hypothetical protein